MSNNSKKVIGYFSFIDRESVICSGDACVIAGSENEMLEYIKRLDPENVNITKTKKTRFGEILIGMQKGGAYAFDKESYSRFQPLALKEGINISDLIFEDESKNEDDFLIIRLDIN